jgi:antitoxin component HigA of HigAB toxin-antitoxin module
MIDPLESEDDYAAALRNLRELMDADPQTDDELRAMSDLADVICAYERGRWPAWMTA